MLICLPILDLVICAVLLLCFSSVAVEPSISYDETHVQSIQACNETSF